MNSLNHKYYGTLLLSLKCQKTVNGINAAKPILVISIIDYLSIESNCDNTFDYKRLGEIYNHNRTKMGCTTPFYYPAYHLQSDGFWHLVWKDGMTPSGKSDKYLRENVICGMIDESLWNILQDKEQRDHYRDLVYRHYLENKNQ